MYLMYVDESGDCGKVGSPTRYFILSAIVIHELNWRNVLSQLVAFRRVLKANKGLRIKEEIHCTHLINSPGDLVRIKRNDRLDIIKKSIDWIESQQEIRVFSVVVDKDNCKGDVFETAWNALLMRYENTINYNNFGTSPNVSDKGIVLCDNTDAVKLRTILRKMRHYNNIPNKSEVYGSGVRNVTIQHVIEDPVFRDSSFSLMHQMSDVLAYCTRQLYEPNAYMKKKGGHLFFNRLNNCLVRKVSANKNGIVDI